MKSPSLLVLLFAGIFPSFAAPLQPAIRDSVSLHPSTNTSIIWQAATDKLPTAVWTYRRLGPKTFSATVISNAFVLASLQSKGFPPTSTNDFFIPEDHPANYPGVIPVMFGIIPSAATVEYYAPGSSSNAALNEVFPSDGTLTLRAGNIASLLGLDSRRMLVKPVVSDFNLDENHDPLTNQIRGRYVRFSRLLNGFGFWDDDGAQNCAEGCWVEFGSHDKVRGFGLTWPDLVTNRLCQTATLHQFVACLRANKLMVLPNPDEATFFQWVKTLGTAKKITITKLTPYYGEGNLGEVPAANDAPPEIIIPFAELECVADFGNSNTTFRLLSPLLSADATKLLARDGK